MTGPKIRPYNEALDKAALVAAATADKHSIVRPSHVVEKDGKIVGYLGYGQMPLVMMWLDSKEVNAFDSACVENFFLNLACATGADAVCVPCPKTSPFAELMERAGYVSYGEATWFMKAI